MDKQHILGELKRAAATNGGQALGESPFYRETGIRRADWHGKFWARFSDAVREAGLIPKEFQDEKQYTDEEMLGNYAEFARELGRLPTNGDLKLRKRGFPDFPGAKTYENRFKSKLRLVRHLLTFCASRPDCKDVLAWSQDYVSNNPEEESDASNPENEIGYVYLMKMGKFFKIGRTNNPMRRGREIGIQLPEKSILLHFFRTEDPSGIEIDWHIRFSQKRREGEWFELNAKDIAAFKRRKAFM